MFSQTANKHLLGDGCPRCSKNSEVVFDELLKRVNNIHGPFYSYKEESYKGVSHQMEISCPIHGAFVQIVSNHLAGKGCQSCATYGFDSKAKSSLYMLKSSCGNYTKIGITNNLESRISILKNRTPFEFSVVDSISDTGESVRFYEYIFHHMFGTLGFSGFDGSTEWISCGYNNLDFLYVI